MLLGVEFLRGQRAVRMWGALVTQNILRDRKLVSLMAASKCRALFVRLLRFRLGPRFLSRFNKKQNLGRNVIDDIAYAEAQGIAIGYGYLFDPRFQTVPEMEVQLRQIGDSDALSMPIYLSLVAPLVGTEVFWKDLRANNLAPNLRLRDLDSWKPLPTPLSPTLRKIYQHFWNDCFAAVGDTGVDRPSPKSCTHCSANLPTGSLSAYNQLTCSLSAPASP